MSFDTSTATMVANSVTSGGNLECLGCKPDCALTACRTASLDDVISCNWLGGSFIPASTNACVKHCATSRANWIGYAVSSLVAK